MPETKQTVPTADKITGSARENIVTTMGEIAIAIDACSSATFELHTIQGQYAKGLMLPLPEAGKAIEEAADRAVALYERMREVFK